MLDLRSNSSRLILIGGPTCSGKSDLALDVARKFGGEIINADSMQIYKYFDIGTAKPKRELLELVPHHLIDIIEPDQPFDAKSFVEAADIAIHEILGRGRIPIVVGGTGLYLRALLYGLFEAKKDENLRARLVEEYKKDPLKLYARLSEIDASYARRISQADRLRIVRAIEIYLMTGKTMSELEREHGFRNPRYEAFFIGLIRERKELYSRINKRVEKMLSCGWVDEVKRILMMGYDEGIKPLKSIGYNEIIQYLKGKLNYDEMVSIIKRKTRAYAKRQITWFKKEKGIRWYRYPEEKERIFMDIEEYLRHGK